MIFAPMYWGYNLTFIQCVGSATLGAVLELVMEAFFCPVGYRISKRWEENNIGAEYIEKYNTK